MNPRARLLELSRACGFDHAAIAAVPADGDAPRALAFAEWLARGLHGPLDYLHSAQGTRRHVRQRWPWVRSVLCVACFYEGQERGVPGRDFVAHVARYARGRDYHFVLKRRLKELQRRIEEEGLARQARNFVDVAPVLERAWAEASGLGWIGKNACLIHPQRGSYMVLGELLLDCEAEPDVPPDRGPPNHCGTCRRCLDACPTQALVAPGMLDAARCIVTHNIERRGETPPELLELQGSWAAGCDACQTVCPYNAPERIEKPDPELSKPLPWQSFSIAEVIKLDAETYNRAFPASALRRTSRTGLRLGAITVAGNMKLADCTDALTECLQDDESLIRDRAAWALEKIKTGTHA